MKSFIYVALVALLFAGCAVTESGNIVLKEKTKDEIQRSIIKGKTTKDQVFKIYGEPALKDLLSNGGEKWFYQYVSTQDKPENHIPFIGAFKNSVDGEERDLIILFNKKGIVTNFDISVKKIQASSGIMGTHYEKK